MVSPSGVRGIVGDRFTPEIVLRVTAAHASLLGPGPIVVGRDSRPSGAWVMRAVIAALLAAGRDVIEIGIAPTPTILFAIQHHRAAGGIAITASHNPAPWNALKLFGPGGTFLAPAAAETVFLRVREGGFRWSRHDGVGSIRADDDAIRRHRDAILALPGLGVDVIRKRRFKVAVDCVNGAGSIATPALLRELGCEVTEIHCVPDGLLAPRSDSRTIPTPTASPSSTKRDIPSARSARSRSRSTGRSASRRGPWSRTPPRRWGSTPWRGAMALRCTAPGWARRTWPRSSDASAG